MVESVQNISLECVHALAGTRRRLSILQKVLGETLPALPFLVSRSNHDSMFGVVRCKLVSVSVGVLSHLLLFSPRSCAAKQPFADSSPAAACSVPVVAPPASTIPFGCWVVARTSLSFSQLLH